MAQLKYNDVATPSFGDAINLFNLAGSSVSSAAEAGKKIFDTYKSNKEDEASAALFKRLATAKSTQDLYNISTDPSLYTNSYLTAKAIRDSFDDRGKLNTALGTAEADVRNQKARELSAKLRGLTPGQIQKYLKEHPEDIQNINTDILNASLASSREMHESAMTDNILYEKASRARKLQSALNNKDYALVEKILTSSPLYYNDTSLLAQERSFANSSRNALKNQVERDLATMATSEGIAKEDLPFSPVFTEYVAKLSPTEREIIQESFPNDVDVFRKTQPMSIPSKELTVEKRLAEESEQKAIQEALKASQALERSTSFTKNTGRALDTAMFHQGLGRGNIRSSSPTKNEEISSILPDNVNSEQFLKEFSPEYQQEIMTNPYISNAVAQLIKEKGYEEATASLSKYTSTFKPKSTGELLSIVYNLLGDEASKNLSPQNKRIYSLYSQEKTRNNQALKQAGISPEYNSLSLRDIVKETKAEAELAKQRNLDIPKNNQTNVIDLGEINGDGNIVYGPALKQGVSDAMYNTEKNLQTMQQVFTTLGIDPSTGKSLPVSQDIGELSKVLAKGISSEEGSVSKIQAQIADDLLYFKSLGLSPDIVYPLLTIDPSNPLTKFFTGSTGRIDREKFKNYISDVYHLNGDFSAKSVQKIYEQRDAFKKASTNYSELSKKHNELRTQLKNIETQLSNAKTPSQKRALNTKYIYLIRQYSDIVQALENTIFENALK